MISVIQVLIICGSVHHLAHAQGGTGGQGNQCTVNDGLGSAGYCVDSLTQASICLLTGVLPSNDCSTGLSCCYLGLAAALSTPAPGASAQPATFPPFVFTTPFNPIFPTTYNPYLPTPYNPYLSFNPYDPYATTTYSPYNPYSPITPAGRLCGRLRSNTISNNVSADEDLSANGARTVRVLKKGDRMKRIVGGDVVLNREYCYQAVIVSGTTIVATGVLISEDYVLTSYSGIARVDPTGRNLKVLLGGTTSLAGVLQAGIPGFPVIEVIKGTGFNANYGPGFPINDIALIRINKGTGLDWTTACTICLAPSPLRQTDCRSIVVSGYGSTSEVSTLSDGILRRVAVNLIPKPVCENVYKGVFGKQFVFDANSMCAGGEPGKDTCNKDGGAPLTCITYGGDRYLLGLSSWGYGCGRSGFPGVYTNVTGFMPWIRTLVTI